MSIIMEKNRGIFLLVIGIIIVSLSIYLLSIDPLIAGIGLIVGIWNVINGILTLMGKSFFQSKEEDE